MFNLEHTVAYQEICPPAPPFGGERVEGREEKVEPVTGRDMTPNGPRFRDVQ